MLPVQLILFLFEREQFSILAIPILYVYFLIYFYAH